MFLWYRIGAPCEEPATNFGPRCRMTRCREPIGKRSPLCPLCLCGESYAPGPTGAPLHRWRRPGLLLLERSVHQEIHGRRPPVARHETLPEVACEIVVGGLRLGLDNAADRIGEAPLHVEPGKCREDALHFVRRDPVVLESEFNADPSRAERHFRLLVQADRRGGIQGDTVPDQLHPAVVEDLRARERARRVRSFYLEALGTGEALREPKV